MKFNFGRLFVVLSVGVLIVSCAKERDYDEVYKDAQITSKVSAINEDATFLYVPSTLGVPKDVSAARAFFQGDSKLVKMKFTENNIEILEIPKEDKFSDNELNSTPVLSIPVSYVDYKCVENSQGECTNQETVDTELTWEQKRFFQPNFESLTVNEVNSLDLFNLDPGCISQVGSKLVDYEMNNDVLNIVLEKTYKVSTAFQCIADLYYSDSMSAAGFKVKFFYSMVRVNKLQSPDYEPINYPVQDHSVFGFFKTKKEETVDDYDESRTKITYLLNRWNPKRKEIVYYLNGNFKKSENSIVKDATYEAFKRINYGLKKANIGFKLVLKEPSDKVKEGDIRYNTINLIDEPLAIGLLGYGPTVAIPTTGEIVQGHVNMYSGVLRSTIRQTYDSMVDLSKERFVKPVVPANVEVKDAVKVASSHASPVSLNSILNTSVSRLSSSGLDKLVRFSDVSHSISLKNLQQMNEATLVEKDSAIRSEFFLLNEEERLTHLGQIAADTQEIVNVTELAKTEIEGIREVLGIDNDNDVLPDFESLSDLMKKKVVDHILPKLYVQTLVHEMGHNLGLRHNFMGSFDKNNYMNESQVQNVKNELGDEKAVAPSYSSIMDYAKSDLNSLSVFGNYDIAALRFGYAREVIADSGEVVPIRTTLNDSSEKGRYFMYCTDENAELSSRCNRHDEGSSYLEIAQSFVLDYDRGYKYRHFRNGRNRFSTYDIISAVGGSNWRFRRARMLFEDYETYADIFGAQLMEVGCSDEQVAQYPVCVTINDLRDAVATVSNKFIEIIKTPDLSCALASTEAPDETVEVVKLRPIYESELRYNMSYIPTSCFDENVKAYFLQNSKVVKGEAGQYLNHIKDPSDEYVYASDIGVRGFWYDKILAMKYLSNRYSGVSSTEGTHGSMADISSVQGELINIFSNILLGEALQNPIPFTKEDGTTYVEEYSLDNSDKVFEQTDGRVIRFLGLPSTSDVELNKVLIKMFVRSNKTADPTYESLSKSLVGMVSVYKLPFYQNVSDDILKLVVGDSIYTATDREQVAQIILSTVKAKETLSAVSQEEVAAVFAIKNGQFEIPAEFSDDQKAVLGIDLSLLTQIQSLVAQGAVYTEDELTPMLGAELARPAAIAFTMTVEELAAMIDFIHTAQSAPADASKELKAVYDLSASILQEFLSGTLDSKIEKYMESLDYLNVM